jgi:V-type H+-transporting ATPase subunit d
MITINSFDTGLTQDERAKLYPTCGHLYPDGLQELRRTDSYDAVRDVAARYPVNYFFCLINLLFVLF